MAARAGLREEAAAAIRRVNLAYGQHPEASWPALDTEAWDRLEAAIDHALAADDHGAGLHAISAWEEHALRRLEEAVR